MPKHKKWINKKHSKTFRLVQQSQNANKYDDEQMQQSAGEKNMEEYDKCGIYFDDDYNYMQHLKEVNDTRSITKNGVEQSIIRIPQDKTKLATNVIEANGYEINAELLKLGTLPGEMHIDPYVIAELADDNIDENSTSDLDDDFVLQANGGELPPLQPPVSFSLQKNEFRGKTTNSDDESDEEMMSDSNYDDDQVSEEDAFAIMENNEELRPIDEQFDKLCGEYTETDDEEIDEEEEKCLLDPNSDQMKILAENFKNKKVELVLQNDIVAQRYPETNDETTEADEMEKIMIDYPNKKKAKWDCETIVSTYSNIYNRPALIIDSSRKQKLKTILRQFEKMDCSMDCSVQSTNKSTVSKASVITIRKHGETAEERKRRKAAVKAIRAERRAEKKCNKLTFKEERKKRVACCGDSVIKMRPIV